MIKGNHQKFEVMLDRYRMKAQSFYVVGGIGIGKSFTVEQNARKYAEAKGLIFVAWNKLNMKQKIDMLITDVVSKHHIFFDLRTALLEPNDMMGLPFADPDKHFVSWKAPLAFKVMSNKKCSATVFFDEFNLGSRLVQNACYQAFNDRSIGEITFGDDVFLLAAGNRAEDHGNIIEAPMPLNNRFGHMELQIPTVPEWVTWQLKTDVSNTNLAGFLSFAPEYLYNYSDKIKEKAFCTPRSLQKACMMQEPGDDYSMLMDIYQSLCGTTMAIKYITFCKLQEKINIDEIIANPSSIANHDKDRAPDLFYAILSGLAAKVKQDPKKNLERVADVSSYLRGEMSLFLCKMLKDLVKPNVWREFCLNSPVYEKKISPKIGKFLI